mmetsp:Transcript_6513/g.9084  ORF Transcript_6513/g.9084 Transcript_6513/m.9084 type:complete len:124 (-) Transcript_6513:894-1265(-)
MVGVSDLLVNGVRDELVNEMTLLIHCIHPLTPTTLFTHSTTYSTQNLIYLLPLSLLQPLIYLPNTHLTHSLQSLIPLNHSPIHSLINFYLPHSLHSLKSNTLTHFLSHSSTHSKYLFHSSLHY